MANHTLSLDNWFLDKDAKNDGVQRDWHKKVSPSAIPVAVPSIIQQYFPEYHGVVFYWCAFVPNPLTHETDRTVLRFGGVDYKAQIWLNGDLLGEEESGETPFSFDITEKVKQGEENLLAVRVINPTAETVDGLNLFNTPHRNKEIKKCAGANLNHGGIWFAVTVETLPAVYADDVFFLGDIQSGRLTAKADLVSHACATPITFRLAVYRKTDGSALVACETKETTVEGNGKVTLSLTVPQVRLWSVDDPYLYRVELTLGTRYGAQSVSKGFGFRAFCVKNGKFHLNGKPIFLRSAHTGNVFPIGQMFPAVPELLRRDLILAKACGFNMLRSIAGLLRPEQLEVADEIGLLIYEECLASWHMGYSSISCHEDEEKLKQFIEERKLTPLGDTGKMLERWNKATEGMIKRDRNHASVVVWGLLNETYYSNIFRNAAAFLPRARALDETRLIVLASGRWDLDFRIGSLSNPYGNEWEEQWGADGTRRYTYKDGAEFHKYEALSGDYHYYPPLPFSAEAVKNIRALGTPERPVFFSENGAASQFHVIEEHKSFLQVGARADLEDASWLAYQSEAFAKDFEHLGLTDVFPFPENMLKETQRANAETRREIFDMVRSNPNIVGYSLTGLLDHGMCGEGLWSFWRRMKPGMFDAVSGGWAPVRFCLFMPRVFYSGEEITIEAVLANDGVLASGTYTADFAVVSKAGTALRFTERFALKGDDFATPIFKRAYTLSLPKGEYTLVASLREGVAEGRSYTFSVEEKNGLSVDGVKVYTAALAPETEAFLRDLGASVLPFDGQTDGLVLLGDADAPTLAKASHAAEEGARVLLLSASALIDEEKRTSLNAGFAFTTPKRPDWLYHSDYVMTRGTVFDEIGSGLVTYERFGDAFPHNALLTDVMPDYILCPGFATGYHAAPKLSYAMCWALSGFKKGKGTLFFNTFGIEGNLGHPTADRLLSGLLRYMQGI